MRQSEIKARLNDQLRERYKVRSIAVRKGDTVRIVRGDFTGIEGKVSEIDTQKGRIYVDGVSREKVRGTSAKVPVHISKVEVSSLNLDDKWRAESVKAKIQSLTEPAPEKGAE